MLPTGNSHFFAARFRNTPGLMPSRELCNQGHRSRAKQTRLCVQSRPRGSTLGQGEAPAGPRGQKGLLSKSGRRRLDPAPPRSQAERPAAGGLGRVGQGSAPPPPRPPPPPGGELGPKSRRTPSPPAARTTSGLGGGGAGSAGLQSRLHSSSGPFRPPPQPLNPRSWGSRALWCGKVMTPPPNSGGNRRGRTRASSATPQSLCPGGGGAGRGDSCANDAPPPPVPRAWAPRSPHAGLCADPDARADGLGGTVGIANSEPQEIRGPDSGSGLC